MNKTPRLSKSGIEYLDYSWGIFSGCENWASGICPVPNCWARSIAYRFPNHYPDGFNPHYYPEAINSPKHLKKPSLIGVGWVGDVIGYGLEHKDEIFETIRQCPQHKFLFLTKNFEQLKEWGSFPDTCYVGITATNADMAVEGLIALSEIEAKGKFMSLEPLLSRIPLTAKGLSGLDLVIVGAQSKPTVYPEIGWVQGIALACTKADIPLFLKDNVKPLLPNRMPFYGTYIWKEMSNGAMITMSENRYRQELPE